MSTPLGITTGNSNSWTLARGHSESKLVCGFVGFDALNTGPYSISFAGIMGVFVVDEVNVLEVMRPDA